MNVRINPVCNGCGERNERSKEHVVHVEIGRVMLGRYDLAPRQVRGGIEALNSKMAVGKSQEVRPIRWDAEIRNLLCEPCNGGWASDLEVRAARNLRSLIDGGGRADADLLRRWAWFFSVKLWWAYRRTESLRAGWLRQGLALVQDPDQETAFRMRTHVCRLVDGPEVPFMCSHELWVDAAGGVTGYITWVIRNTMWIVGLPDENDDAQIPNLNTRPLGQGLRLSAFPETSMLDAGVWFIAPPSLVDG